MSATLLLGIAGIGAAAILAIEKKRAGTQLPQDASPMSYPDTTQYSPTDPRADGAKDGEGGIQDLAGLGDLGVVGTQGPVNEPETPASGTGPTHPTLGPSGLLSTGPAQPSPGITVFHRTLPLTTYAFGENTGAVGKSMTSQTYATVGPKIGAIW